MKLSRLLGTISFLTSLAPLVLGDTLEVPSDFATIQAAIDASVSGDVVRVGPGTYVENLDFLGKSITVESTQGPTMTRVEPLDGVVVAFTSGEGRNAILRGFTLRKGSSNSTAPCFSEGGGVCILDSSPTVEGNIIVDNTACAGAGIAVGFGSPLIQGNVISGNRQSGCSGGIGGGGISVRGAGLTKIVGNWIANNSTESPGGGITLFAAGDPVIEGNVIQGNSSREGGGIWIVNRSDALIVNNAIIENRAPEGGGIYWLVPAGQAGPRLVTNTIAGNDSPLGSGILADGFDGSALLVDNVVAAAPGQTAIFCGDLNDQNSPQFEFNNVFSASGLAYGGICGNPTGLNGNISADPLFRDAAASDYRLDPGSPSVDAGDNGALSLPPKDIEGKPRIVDGDGDGLAVVDMGAFERALLLCNIDLSLEGRRLRLHFDLASTEPSTWSTWVAFSHYIVPLWSVPIPAIDPSLSFDIPWDNFPALGEIAIITSLSTAEKGMVCLETDRIQTGGAGAGRETLQYLLLRERPAKVGR